MCTGVKRNNDRSQSIIFYTIMLLFFIFLSLPSRKKEREKEKLEYKR